MPTLARGEECPGITIMLDCAPEKTTLGGLAPVKFSRRPRRRLKKAHNLPSQFSAAGKIGKKREKCYENLVLFWGDAGATGPQRLELGLTARIEAAGVQDS